MTYYIGSIPFGGDDIQHHGIKGMKWGIRRYRNEDGTLTEEGRQRYRDDAKSARRQIGEASRNPVTSVGVYEGKYMTSGLFKGHKYRKLQNTILANTRKEGSAYNNAVNNAVKSAAKKNSILFDGSNKAAGQKRADAKREAGRNLADAIASVSTQFISENFPESQQQRAMAWVYSQFVQGQDRDIRVNFDEYDD